LEEISSVLAKFRLGIETGDENAAQELVSRGPFSSVILAFYQMLQKAYMGRTFPMDVEKVKILKDGRAKAVAYLTEDRGRFVFTLVRSRNQWKISHLETILIPLHSVPPTPYDGILRLDDEQRALISSEQEVHFVSRVYKELKETGGKEYAQRFFLDGAEFKVAMDAWLPFIEGAAQFALYTAVMEANLWGSKCTVMHADENRAELVLHPHAHLDVIRRAFFRDKIGEEEYRELYSLVMKDRAKHCQLDLSISFEDVKCTIVVTTRSRFPSDAKADVASGVEGAGPTC